MVDIQQIADLIDAKVLGKKDDKISDLSSFKSSTNSSICVVFGRKYYKDAINSKCGSIVVSNKDTEIHNIKKNILIVHDVRYSMFLLSKFFKSQSEKHYCPKSNSLNISESAVIEKNVNIGLNCNIGHNAVIESGVTLGNNVYIDSNVVIHRGVIVGDSVSIFSGTVIGSEGFGNIKNNQNKWLHIDHLGSVVIGSNVRIGANCTIDRGTLDDTIIQDGVILDNSVHIAHNVIIGSDTAIAAKVGIAGSSKIGKRNLIGGMVGIIDHITTVDDVTISATSTVSRNINKPGVYTGIMPISQHASWRRLAFWFTKLDKIVKHINFKN